MTRKLTSNFKNHATILFVSSILGILIYAYLSFSHNGSSITSPALHIHISVILTACIGGYSSFYTSKFINYLWNWNKAPALKILIKTLIISSVGWAVITVISNLLINAFREFTNIPVPDLNYTELKIRLAILIGTIAFLFTLTNYLLHAYKTYIYINVREIEQQKEKSLLQLEILQKQLSPHYLFNSLNTISNLLDNSAELTETFIRKLVYTYSYVLTSCNKELVLLKEELKLIKAYQHQLETRFEQKINITYNIHDDCLTKHIPPLGIQVLIENAIKHNIASQNDPINIKIEAQKETLTVTNNITQAPEQTNSGGIGLSNLIKRYNLLGDYNIKIKHTKDFIVQLPLI